MSNVLNTEDKNPTISIIIINYNLAEEIENCLDSLFNIVDSIKTLTYEVIIIDNDSPDRRIEETEKRYKNDSIHFYFLDQNLGFGKGCNYGFSKASGKYVCFLNPDTLLKEDIFTPIIKKFENDKKIGIIGPKQQTKPPFFDFSAGFSPNLFFEFFNLLGIGIFLEGFIVNLYTRFSSKELLNVNWILGAAIFMKAEIFRSIDGFDNDYFMFFEEVDLCKKVADRKLKILYYPSSRIHHIGSVSGKKNYKLYTIRTYASKFIYVNKNYGFIKKNVMSIMLFAQLTSQIIIWLLLLPVKGDKSKQKISAFVYLLGNRMQNKIDTVS